MQIQKTNFTTKHLLATASIVVLLLLGWAIYAYSTDKWPFAASTSQADSESENINYNPPTEQEIAEGQEAKKRGEGQSSENQPSEQPNDPGSGTKTSVNVGISFADVYQNNLEVRAFTNGIIKGDGTCTAIVSMKNSPSTKITKESKAFIDTSTTQCQPIYIPVSDLASGTWDVVVMFSSPDHEGVSQKVEVNIP